MDLHLNPEERITALEAQRDEIYQEIAGWLRDARDYFPNAVGLHDVFRGIEAMEKQLAEYKARMAWLDERVYYAEWQDKDGRHAQQQPGEQGYWDKDAMGEFFSFSEFTHTTMKEKS
jgi:hypothetical protein